MRSWTLAAARFDRPLRDRGLQSAVAQAKAAAGDKAIGVYGSDTIHQLLNAGWSMS